MVAYDYSKEPNNPWDLETWDPRAQIEFMRRMRYKFGGTKGNAEARIMQRIAQSNTKGMPPPTTGKKSPYQVIIQKRITVVPGVGTVGVSQPPILGFNQTGTMSDAQRFAMGVVPMTTVFPGTMSSEARCDTAPTGDVSLTLVDANANVLCTISFAAGSTVGTFAWGPPVTVGPGDLLYVNGPSPADLTFAGVNIAFIGQ
jgi:hypothetical protein